jgi:murein DD-endopeptidase MepM/ murein hydrolase activator NlpD
MMRYRRLILLAGLAVWAALSSPAMAAPPHQGGRVHVVQPGETLGYIGLRYAVSVADLVTANGLADPDRIVVGQQLHIPSAQASEAAVRVHTVHAGETLLRIAQRYQVSITDLAAANTLVDPDYILVGQQLTIPPHARAEAEVGLPAPFTDVQFSPAPVLQGQTLVVRVRADGLSPQAGIHCRFLDQEFELISSSSISGEWWGLVGVPALTEPGQYALALTAGVYQTTASSWVTVVAGDFSTDYIQLSAETSRLLDPVLIQEEWAKLNRHWSRLYSPKLWQASFGLPVASGTRVSSPFGTRRSYNGQPARSYHEGMDFAAQGGTPVTAPAAGRVVLAEELTVRGGGVLIDHGQGVVSGYFHLSAVEVEPGVKVEPGDVIGRVGSTGLSTGDHLHWEIRVRSVPVDPQQWMQYSIP